ncbi:MAG: hypothetical protein L0Z52_05345 [Acidobacteria bacterium]|nr:hypothetical protein [Acidobacteriota bacterium]
MPWIVLLVATPLLTAIGYGSGMPWLLPLLQVLPAYPVMVRDLRQERVGQAVLKMLFWALLIAITVELLAVYAPARGELSVIHGTAYRDEMISWIRAGVGRESSWRLFVPQHVFHLVLFILLSLASGSLLSLVLGAALMNYMSYYVGSLIGIAQVPSVPLLAGWPPWAILRVASFVILGVVLAGPALKRFAGVPFGWEGKRVWFILAGSGLILDVLLKLLLAPRWSALLRSALFPLA